MINRLTVALEQPEYSALLTICTQELRNPEDQIRYIIRRELEQRGLIRVDAQPADVRMGEVQQ